MRGKRVLSGLRPTSDRMTLGNYFGAVKNWVGLQDDYECFFFIADWHAMTSNYDNPGVIRGNTLDQALDFLSAGLDPERSVLFLQSAVKQHAELPLLLGMTIPLGWIYRTPAFKEVLGLTDEDAIAPDQAGNVWIWDFVHRDKVDYHLYTYGMLGYPVLMASDIILYDADYVPVGKDQVPHVEFAREIVRRFNKCAPGAELVEPQALLTPTPWVPGPDGRKMSKSSGNYIAITEDPAEFGPKIMKAVTDPKKVRRNDPGNPDVCNVFYYYNMLEYEGVKTVEETCRSGERGCVDCKRELCGAMADYFEPMRKRRDEWTGKGEKALRELLTEGSSRARVVAENTTARARKGIDLLSLAT